MQFCTLPMRVQTAPLVQWTADVDLGGSFAITGIARECATRIGGCPEYGPADRAADHLTRRGWPSFRTRPDSLSVMLSVGLIAMDATILATAVPLDR